MFIGVSKIKFPDGKFGHTLFYLHFLSNLCEYAKTTFHFINLTIEDTREQKYFTVSKYSAIKNGIRNSCDKQQNHVLPKLCGAWGHQTERISNWLMIMWWFHFHCWVWRYFVCTVNWNKKLSVGWESRAVRNIRGGRKVSDFTCPSEIRCFYPSRLDFCSDDFSSTLAQTGREHLIN